MRELFRETEIREIRLSLPRRSIGNSNAENLKSRARHRVGGGVQVAQHARPVFSGVGGILGSYSVTHVSPNGSQLPFGIGSLFAPSPSQMLGPYTGGYAPADSGIFTS
jgi:hypothetical protein